MIKDGSEGSGERMKTKGRSRRMDGCADDGMQVEGRKYRDYTFCKKY